MGAAALPGGAGQVRRDRLDQAGVGVGSDQQHAGQAAGDEVGEEAVPRLFGFAGGDPDAEDLAVAIGVHPGRHQDDGVHDAAVLADLHRQRVRRDERERSRLAQRPGPERGHLLVELGRHP